MAQRRVEEASTLLASGHHGGAFYLAGYALELGLKACIARPFVSDEIPAWAERGEIRTHDARVLVRLADLETDLTEARRASASFDVNVETALTWKVESRYDLAATPEGTQRFLEALTDEDEGVLKWIASRW